MMLRWDSQKMLAASSYLVCCAWIALAAAAAAARASGPDMHVFHTKTFPYPSIQAATLLDGSFILRPPGAPGVCFYVSKGDPTKWRLVQPQIGPSWGDPIADRQFKIARGGYGRWFFFSRRHRTPAFPTRIPHWLASCGLHGRVRWVQLLGRMPRADFANGLTGAGTIERNLIVTTDGGTTWKPEPPFEAALKSPFKMGPYYIQFVSKRRFLVLIAGRNSTLLLGRIKSNETLATLWQMPLSRTAWPVALTRRNLWMGQTRPTGFWEVDPGQQSPDTSLGGQIDEYDLSSGKRIGTYKIGKLYPQLRSTFGKEKSWNVQLKVFHHRMLLLFLGEGFAEVAPTAKGGFDLLAAKRVADASLLLPDGPGMIGIFDTAGHIFLYDFSSKSLKQATFEIAGTPWVKPPERMAGLKEMQAYFRLGKGLPDATVERLGAAALEKFGRHRQAASIEWLITQFRIAHKRLGIPIEPAVEKK